MWQYNYGYPNELYHHGVLGMKWGQHRVARLERAARTSSRDAKELNKYGYKEEASAVQKVADKNAAKAKKIKSKMNRYTTKQTQKQVQNLGDAEAIAQSYLLGSYGALVYNSLKAKGKSTGEAAVKASVNSWANSMSFGYLSRHRSLKW